MFIVAPIDRYDELSRRRKAKGAEADYLFTHVVMDAKYTLPAKPRIDNMPEVAGNLRQAAAEGGKTIVMLNPLTPLILEEGQP